MQRLYYNICFLLLYIFYACNSDNTIVEGKYDIQNPDTLSRELVDGIFLSCDSLKDKYNLDEPLFSNVYLENISNDDGLYIFIGSYPPFISWHITDLDDNYISGGPTVIYMAEFSDTLKIGQKLHDRFEWHHHVTDPYEMYSGLKAFSGKYSIYIRFRGIPWKYKPYLVKKFEITEIGDPLSSHLFFDYNDEDSIKYDFILRNRIKNEITLSRSEYESKLYFLNTSKQDTLFQHSFNLENSEYKLKGHSDNILAKLRFSKKYFEDLGLTGAFDVLVILRFKERVISQGALLFIL